MIKEIIVVEGKDDTSAIRQAVNADTIETGGSAINDEILRSIALAQQRRGVIIFTDPDHAGERIRRIITERVPGCKQAFIDPEEAQHRGKIGVEHADSESILRALAAARTDYMQPAAEITWSDLIEAGLIHHPRAATRRLVVGKALGFGYANGKQFFRRCAMFQISQEEFAAALNVLKGQGKNDG